MSCKIVVEQYRPDPEPQDFGLTDSWYYVDSVFQGVNFKHRISGHEVQIQRIPGFVIGRKVFDVPPIDDREWAQQIIVYVAKCKFDDPAEIYLKIEKWAKRFLHFIPDVEITTNENSWSIRISDMAEMDEEAGPVKKTLTIHHGDPNWEKAIKAGLLDLDMKS